MTYLIILICYSALMIAIGAIYSRRVKATSDFFVAGRGLSGWLLLSTLLAANIGAGSTVGAAGFGYRDGLSAWWWVGSAGIGSLILAFVIGPKIWRIARDNNLYTVGDYLEFRYNRWVRGLVSLFLWIGSLAILAGQLIAVAWILNVVAGIGKPIGCLIAAAVITIYFTLGGLHSAARVNVIQLIVKLAGFTAAFIFFMHQFGGLEPIKAAVDGAVKNKDSYFSLTGIGAHGVWTYVILLAPSFFISPGLLQKVFGARDERAVRLGVGLNALGLLAFAIMPALLGVIAFSKFPGLKPSESELALPMLLTQALPIGLGGLLLAAIFSAELSAADAVLFMLSTSLSKDLYKSFLNPAADDRKLMFVARTTAVICGILGGFLGILLPTVIDALKIFYTLLTAALFLPLVAGLYLKRITSLAALSTMLVSVIATFTLERMTAGKGMWGFPSLVLGIAAGAIVMTAFSLRKIDN